MDLSFRNFVFPTLLLVAAVAEAQLDSLDPLLEAPISPGIVGLLTEHARDPRVEETLSGALSHPDAAVRAAAARNARASGTKALLPSLVAALEREEDLSAAGEMIRAVAALGTDSEDEAILAAARRLRLAWVAADALAASRGARALAHLEALRAMESPLILASFLKRAARGRLDVLGPTVASAFRSGDVELWAAYLQLAREGENVADTDTGALTFGLRSEALRYETLWHLLVTGDARPELDETLRETLTMLDAAAPSDDVDRVFLAELLWRRLGREARDIETWIDARRNGEASRFTERIWSDTSPELPLMAPAERRALSRQIWDQNDYLDDLLDGKWGSVLGDSESASGGTLFRTVSSFPAGFVADLLSVTGCDPEEYEGIVGADIDYSFDGRPLRVALRPVHDVSEGCASAARALMLNDVSSEIAPDKNAEHVLVLVEPDYLGCLSEPPPGFPPSKDAPRESVAPRKTRDIAPTYPASARDELVQGTQILEATISPTGCISSLRVTGSTDDRLAFASVLAVSRWRYEPTRHDGVAVPVLMTVTVTFELN